VKITQGWRLGLSEDNTRVEAGDPDYVEERSLVQPPEERRLDLTF